MESIQKYGILLRPLEIGDLARVRQWRNAPHVRSSMEFQEEITPAMHKRWWQNLEQTCNLYYVIEQDKDAIGVIHAKDIDWIERSSETGIFIGQIAYLNSFVPVLAVLALMDYMFEALQLETLRAKVMTNNKRIMDFNQKLGYEVVRENNNFSMLTVSKARYFEHTKSLREMALRISNPNKI